MRRSRLPVSLILLVAATLAGCDPEDPVTEPETPRDEPTTVWGLTAIAMGDDMVKLSWKAPQRNTHYMYKIRWRTFGATEDEGSTFEADNGSGGYEFQALIDRLKPEMYKFTVEAVVPGSYTVLPGVDVYGAPAVRLIDDAARPGERLRLYEPASDRGNGLSIDLETGGATRIVPAEAAPGTLQFLLLLEGSGLSPFQMRFAVAGIVEANIPAGIYDPTAWIRSSSCLNCGLDAMYVSYDAYLKEHNPFLEVSRDLSRVSSDKEETSAYVEGAVIGAGDRNGPNYRIARIVFYRAPDGTLLHGEAPNRFVEIQLSMGYRGVPFA